MQPKIIEDFISKDTANYLYKTLKEQATINPNGLLNVYLTERVSTKFSNNILDDTIKLIVMSVSNQLGFKNKQVKLNRINYQILKQDQELGYHSDKNGAYGNTIEYEGYSALVYLTHDYEGGEILFYNDNSGSKESAISYHPKAGSLIYFKGDDDHPHSVIKVLSGERAILILFFDVLND